MQTSTLWSRGLILCVILCKDSGECLRRNEGSKISDGEWHRRKLWITDY